MRILTGIILLSCIVGCKGNDELPAGILSKEKMQGVFWDIIQVEAYTSQHLKNDISKNASLEDAKLQQRVFAIHKINKEDFYTSYTYYSAHVELMRSLLDSITTKAEREKYTILYSKPPKPVPMRVSLMPLPPPPPLKLIPMPIPGSSPVAAQMPMVVPMPGTPFVPSINNGKTNSDKPL